MSEDPEDRILRWLILAHVVNHGTSTAARSRTTAPRADTRPGDLDLLDALTMPWPGE